MAITTKRPGRDRRLQLADRVAETKAPGHRRLDDLEEEVDEIIQRAMCRRLEAATGGRLTFDGDKVVRACRGLTSQS